MDAKEKVAELEERREKRLADLKVLENDQYILDLEAREAIEDETGHIVAAVKVPFKKGFPTRAFVRTPTRVEYKRYTDGIYSAAKKENPRSTREAQELLAGAVWVYPKAKEEREAMLDAFPGLLSTIITAAAKLAEGRSDEEGKD